MARHQARAGCGQGPVATVHCLLESVVNDVKGTGDARGIIDNAAAAATLLAVSSGGRC
jgi:hypothetical protein